MMHLEADSSITPSHLRAIVERAATAESEALFEEFVTKQDFGTWLAREGIAPPAFWFEPELRHRL